MKKMFNVLLCVGKYVSVNECYVWVTDEPSETDYVCDYGRYLQWLSL